MEKFQHIIGKPLPQALAEVVKLGFELRVVTQDNKDKIITMEYIGNRLNVETISGIVTKINSQFFDLDFEFNSEIGLLQKKIDPITTHSINTISKDLEKSNQEIYHNY